MGFYRHLLELWCLADAFTKLGVVCCFSPELFRNLTPSVEPVPVLSLHKLSCHAQTQYPSHSLFKN